MLDRIPAEILSVIFEPFDFLDATWPAIMRLNKHIRKIATATRRRLAVPILQIVERGESAVDYCVDLMSDPKCSCGRAIMLFEPRARDLSLRHFRALMQHIAIGFDMFKDIVMHRPELSLIAWEGCTTQPKCAIADHCEVSAGWRAQNINRWLREKDCRLFMGFDKARHHVESRFQYISIIMAFQRAKPGNVRCFLFNAISEGIYGHLSIVLLYSAAASTASSAEPILSNEFLSVLMNWAVIRGRADCVAVINEIIRRDDAATFPRYSREWLTSGATEHIEFCPSWIACSTADQCIAMLDAKIPSRIRNDVAIHISRVH